MPALVGGRATCEQRGLGLESGAGLRQLGEAEVEDLHPAVAGDEDVLGLQVAVDDALVVRGGEAAGDLDGVVDGLARRQRRGADARAQRLAFEQLRDDVGRAVVAADVVDGEDVRMIERAGRACFLLEPAQPSASAANDAGSTLIATSRPSRVSCAR